MAFDYTAIDADGRQLSGTLPQDSEPEALAELNRQGLTPIRLDRSRASAKASGSGMRRQKKIPPGVAAVLFIRELASLLQAGVTLEESLRTLLEGRKGSAQEAVLTAILSDVLAGERFSSALRTHAAPGSLPLPNFVLALVSAGESTGDLPAALGRAADQMEFDDQIRAETSEALVYPAILIMAGAAAVLFVFSFVVPRFSTLLAGKRADLPWLSAAVMSTGEFVNQHSVALLMAAAALVLGGLALRKALGPERIRSAAAELPVIGPWLQQQELSRWTGMLALMLQSRVPILTSLDLTAAAVSLPEVASKLRQTLADIGRGESISSSLSERGLLPPSALSMVRVGERTGQLGQMMGHVAAYALEQNRRQRRRLVALIEPAAILVLGGIIALVIVGVVLALTSLSEVKF